MYAFLCDVSMLLSMFVLGLSWNGLSAQRFCNCSSSHAVVRQAWRVFFFSVEILALIAKLHDLLPVYLSLYQNEMITDCYGTYGTQSRRI